MGRILILDPVLSHAHLDPKDEIVGTAAETLKKLNRNNFELLLIYPGDLSISRETLIRKALAKAPLLSIALVGGPYPESRIAGTFVDLVIPEDAAPERIRIETDHLIEARKLQLECDLVGKSPELTAITELIFRIAPTDLAVLITGESGTGKELVARAIHRHSGRSRKVFLPVNSAAIPEGTFESELFGHEKGSFTGAVSRHSGYFEQADGGTIFLDEIAEIPPNVQAKLLRVLETGDFIRVGGTGSVHVDVRIIGATNSDLAEAMARRVFREDLYYRLAVIKIDIPPLRQRRNDIPVLIYKFVSEVRETHSGEFGGISDAAISRMMDYHWPGNVRELKNLVVNAVLLAGERPVVPDDLEGYFQEHEKLNRNLPVMIDGKAFGSRNLDSGRIETALAIILSELKILEERIDHLAERIDNADSPTPEKAAKSRILRALASNGFDKKKTATELGISLRTLYRHLKKFGIGV